MRFWPFRKRKGTVGVPDDESFAEVEDDETTVEYVGRHKASEVTDDDAR